MVARISDRDWFRPRGTLHLDARLGVAARPRIEKYVSDPREVERHPFLPFIRYDKEKHKIKLDEAKGRRVYIPGTRPICYAAHLDAQIFAYYSMLLAEKYEASLEANGLSQNVIAFRSLVDLVTGDPKSNIDMANDAFDEILKIGPCNVFAFDVSQFFDSLDRGVLKNQWCNLLKVSELPPDHYGVFKAVTKFKYVMRDEAYARFGIPRNRAASQRLVRICERDEFSREAKKGGFVQTAMNGIPQGSPISAILANIYMLPFDIAVAQEIRKRGGAFFRYCDDIFLILPATDDFEAESWVVTELAKIKLKLNANKTERAKFRWAPDGTLGADRAIQYLGFKFDGRKERIALRPGSFAKNYRKVEKAVDLAIATARKHNHKRLKGGLPAEPIYLKRLYRRHSHLGRRNFIAYSRRAAGIMGSTTILNQINKTDRHFQRELDRARVFAR